jgi:predicted nucleic acid-binding protein
LSHGVCTDDRRARQVTEKWLGSGRLTGTLGLLKRCVSMGLLNAADAFAAYNQMVDMGAFLPEIEPEFFADLGDGK